MTNEPRFEDEFKHSFRMDDRQPLILSLEFATIAQRRHQAKRDAWILEKMKKKTPYTTQFLLGYGMAIGELKKLLGGKE